MKFRSLTNASGSEIQKVRQEEKNAILVQHRPWKLVNNRDGLAYGQLHFGTQKDIRQVNEVEDNELFLMPHILFGYQICNFFSQPIANLLGVAYTMIHGTTAPSFESMFGGTYIITHFGAVVFIFCAVFRTAHL